MSRYILEIHKLHQTRFLNVCFILISQLIANGLLGALGEVVQKPVEEVPRKEQDQNLLKLKMVEMNAVAVTWRHNHVIQTIVEVHTYKTHTNYTKQDFLIHL